MMVTIEAVEGFLDIALKIFFLAEKKSYKAAEHVVDFHCYPSIVY